MASNLCSLSITCLCTCTCICLMHVCCPLLSHNIHLFADLKDRVRYCIAVYNRSSALSPDSSQGQVLCWEKETCSALTMVSQDVCAMGVLHVLADGELHFYFSVHFLTFYCFLHFSSVLLSSFPLSDVILILLSQ